MNNILIRFSTLILSLFIVGHAFAERVTVDGIVYDVLKKGKLAILLDGKSCTGDIVIPEYVTYEGVDCVVKEVGEKAFYDCGTITSIVLPEGVTSIGKSAFFDCYMLTSIVLPDGLSCIEEGTFWLCI